MALGWSWTLSKYTLFRAFQIPQYTTAHISSFSIESLCTNVLNSRKKSLASFGHFLIFPGHKAHMFLAKRPSHGKWPADSGCWQHSSHRASTFTLLWCRLSLVGRILEQTHQMKLRAFGGTFNFQKIMQLEMAKSYKKFYYKKLTKLCVNLFDWCHVTLIK